MSDGRQLVHHELCFGCGRTNLFGLLLEAERPSGAPDTVSGRCFIKQDHQGPLRGHAHPGIVAAALIEVMALVVGEELALSEVALARGGEVPVGAFLTVSARREDDTTVTATASHEDDQVASARGSVKPCRRT